MTDTIDFKITYHVVCEMLDELNRLPNIPPVLRAWRAELDLAKFDFTRAKERAAVCYCDTCGQERDPFE